MIDINAVRKRIRKPTAPVTVPDAKEVSAAFHNGCIQEWTEDRRDLAAALDEISALRQLLPKELVDLLRIPSEAIAKVTAADAAIEALLACTRGEKTT